MPRYETRLRRLETRQLRPVSHFVSTVHIPWEVDEDDEAAWLCALVCPCGQRACQAFRIGAILPEKAPSTEDWAERARQYQEGRRHD